MKYLINILILITTSSLFANEFSGFIYDGETKKPLAGVTIRLEGTGFGAYSKREGNFIIRNIPDGGYRIVFSMIGYELKTLNINFPNDGKKKHEIFLKEQSLKMNEVVVSANKRVQAVQEVPVSVSTIDLKSLTQRNITDIDKALEYVPGVQMNGSQVSIRGSSGFAFGIGSRVAYLLDGFPLLSGDQGDMKFDVIPLFNIERIEVVKGAGSALYGSGALGGVINVITENPDVNGKLKAKVYSGFFTKPKYDEWIYQDYYSMFHGVDLSYSQKINDFGFLVASRMLLDDSYRTYDDRRNENMFIKLNYDFSDNNILSLTGAYAVNDHADWVYWNSLDSATLPPQGTDLNTRINSTKTTVNANYKYIFNNGDFLILRSGVYRTFFGNNLNETDSDFRSSTAYSLNNEIQMNSRFGNNFFLTYGLNYVYNITEASVFGDNRQQTAAAYSQIEIPVLSDLTVTAGIRADYEKTFGDSEENIEISPKAGALYKSPWGINFRASVGKGFRTATLAEKFASLNYGPFKVKPNLNIEPERSWSYETGGNSEFQFLNSLFIVDISLFQNDMNNMIEAQFIQEAGDPFIQFDNVTEARVRGAEIDLKSMLFGVVGLQSALTLMEPKDLTLDNTLKYRSKILWYSGIMIPLSFVELQADYRFVSRSENVDELLNLFIKDADARINAHVVDARIIVNLKDFIGKDISLTINAKNLLDYYYTLYPGNLAPTRSITFQLNAIL
ncbi:TonB-dependent receptor domain-containing protein [Bacteroidota bacterium]